jgi:predicted metal-dependent hydrolase
MAGPLPPYTLRRSPRSRRLRVTIDPALGVVVTVPPATVARWATRGATSNGFLRERESWLRRHLETMARDAATIATRGGLTDGASIRYRGELHRLAIVEASPTSAGRASSGRRGGRRRASRLARGS